MKLLYVSRSPSVHDARFLQAYEHHGIQVSYLTLYPGAMSGTTNIGKSWIPVCLCEESDSRDDRWDDALLRRFRYLVRSFRPDWIQAGPLDSCGYLAAVTGVGRLLLTSWGRDLLIDAERDLLAREKCAGALAAADLFLCDCQTVLNAAKKIAPVDEQRVITMPWGLEAEFWKSVNGREKLRKKLGWENNIILLSTRRWDSIYQIPFLLQAFAIAVKKNPRLRLILLGNGDEALRVQEIIREQELQRYIWLPGFISQPLLGQCFAAADLYISTAINDGSSISLLQAMAAGLGIIVKDVPSNREWIEDGYNGWLWQSASADDLAALLLLAGDRFPAMKQALHENQKMVEKKANWERNVERLIDSLHELLYEMAG